MKAWGLVLWGSLSALPLTTSAGGCGGRADVGVPNHGGDDGGSSGSSSGIAGSSSGVSGSSSGFSGSSTGSSSGISGSSTGSSSGSSSSSGGAYGTIDLEECLTSLCASQSFQVYAQFGTGNSACTGATTGACTYYSCSGGTTGPGVSAGTLTVSSPWLMTPVSIPYGGTLYQYTSSTPGFNAGQTVTVTASGDSVPAFGPGRGGVEAVLRHDRRFLLRAVQRHVLLGRPLRDHTHRAPLCSGKRRLPVESSAVGDRQVVDGAREVRGLERDDP